MQDAIHRIDDAGGGPFGARRIGALVTALAVAFLIACSSGSGGTAPDASGAELEFGSFKLINAERDASEVSPRLRRQEVLNEIARQHSERMRDEGFFSHTTPTGQSLRDRLAAEGYSFTAAGENIARVSNASDAAAHAHQLLMGSPAHRENILGESYREVGVGVAIEDRTVWITQVYVRQAP